MLKDDDIIPFGKHKGTKLANVPAQYLIWLYENDKCYTDLRLYIESNLDILRSENNTTIEEVKVEKEDVKSQSSWDLIFQYYYENADLLENIQDWLKSNYHAPIKKS